MKTTAANASISIGGVGVLGSALFVNLTDIQFTKFTVGGEPLTNASNPDDPFEVLAEGSGTAEIRSSTAHGHRIVVSVVGVGQLAITQNSSVVLAAAGQASSKFIVGQRSSGSARIDDSSVAANEFVVGDGTDEDGGMLNPDLTGTLEIKNSSLFAGEFVVGNEAKGEVAVKEGSNLAVTNLTTIGKKKEGKMIVSETGTLVGTEHMRVGDEEGSQGTLTIQDLGKVNVKLRADIGHFGFGKADVTNAGAKLEAGALFLGNGEESDGELNVTLGARVEVTDVGRPAGVVAPTLTLGAEGDAVLNVFGGSRVDIKKHLQLTNQATGHVEISAGGGSEVISLDDIKEGAGTQNHTIDGTSRVKGKNGSLGKLGLAHIKVRGNSVLEGVEGLEFGGDGGAFVGIYTGGTLSTTATITFDSATTLAGDSSVIADESIVTTASSVTIEPGPEGGGVAPLTFDTPSFNGSSGMTLAIDATASSGSGGAAVSDRLHVTGSASVGGTIALNLGFTPAPWRADGTAGSWIRVLTADDSLSGEMTGSLPDPNSLGLPALATSEHHYEWKVVHDTNDATPYSKLVQLNSAFSSQPWLEGGSGTKDVVLIIMEVPPPDGYDDGYETPVDETLETTERTVDNDVYLGEEDLQGVLVDPPGHGDVTFNPDGTFVYVPDPGFAGIDEFTYKPFCGEYEGDETTVTITVVPGNGPLVAVDDAYSDTQTRYIGVANPAILGNDTGGSSFLSAVLVSDVEHGTLTLNANGGFTYTPDEGFWGQDHFTYRATEGAYQSNIATVTLTIENPTVVAMGNHYDSFIGGTFSVGAPGVIAGDINVTTVALVAGSGPSTGTLTLNADGSFAYQRPPGFTGNVSFQYIGTHGPTGTQSQPATVTINYWGMPMPLSFDGPEGSGATRSLEMAQLTPLGRAAIERWREAGVDDETLLARLQNVQFVIADLPGTMLGGIGGVNTILIDINGAGHGWFVDLTPRDDAEFPRLVSGSQKEAARGAAADRADLLSVVMHEIGHVLGLEHEHAARSGDPTNLMSDTIGLGTRRNPTAWDAAIVDYLYWQSRRRR